MLDALGRDIKYLRLSVTGRCNLRCNYCRPAREKSGCEKSGVCAADADTDTNAPRENEISVRDIKRLVKALCALGVNKVRITGGEPLLRGDLEEIIAAVRAGAGDAGGGIADLCLTTNAQGLSERAAALKGAGLMRVNISLDSLRPRRFAEITGGGSLDKVFAGIDAALKAGLSPVKINCVLMRSINDDEVSGFIALAKTEKIDVRFIELMPLGGSFSGVKNEHLRVSNSEVLAAHPELKALPPRHAAQAALEYSDAGFRGTVGFISPVSKPFCAACSRIRITPDSKLRPCLGDNYEADLKDALSRDDAALLAFIKNVIFNKPAGHKFGENFVPERFMNRIGG